MPPKKSTAKEHSVYIIMQYEYEGTDDFAVENIIYQVHATLEAANTNAESRFDMLVTERNLDATKTSDEDAFTADGRYNQSIKAEPGLKTHEIAVVKKDLYGGTIHPIKQAAAKKAPAAKPKQAIDDDDEADDDGGDDGDKLDNFVAGYQAVNGNSATTKRKATSDASAADENEPESNFPAPTGATNCLADLKILITGTLDDWTRVQANKLIETFGGTAEKTMKKGLDYVVLGANPGDKKLGEIDAMGLEVIDQDGLWQLIETREGDDEEIGGEEVARVCKPVVVKKGKKAAAKKG